MLSRFWREGWDFGANHEQHNHSTLENSLYKRWTCRNGCKFTAKWFATFCRLGPRRGRRSEQNESARASGGPKARFLVWADAGKGVREATCSTRIYKNGAQQSAPEAALSAMNGCAAQHSRRNPILRAKKCWGLGRNGTASGNKLARELASPALHAPFARFYACSRSCFCGKVPSSANHAWFLSDEAASHLVSVLPLAVPFLPKPRPRPLRTSAPGSTAVTLGAWSPTAGSSCCFLSPAG